MPLSVPEIVTPAAFKVWAETVADEVALSEVSVKAPPATGNAATDTANLQAVLDDVPHRVYARTRILLSGDYVIDAAVNAFERVVLLDGSNRASITWDGASGVDMLRFQQCPLSGVHGLVLHGNNDPAKRPRSAIRFESLNTWINKSLLSVRDVRISPPIADDTSFDKFFEYGILVGGENANNDQSVVDNLHVSHAETAFRLEHTQSLVWRIHSAVIRRCGIGFDTSAKYMWLGNISYATNGIDVKLRFGSGAQADTHYSEFSGKILEATHAYYHVKQGQALVTSETHSGGDVIVDHLHGYGFYVFEQFRFFRLGDDPGDRMRIRFAHTSGSHPIYARFSNCWNIGPDQIDTVGGADPALVFDWNGDSATGDTGRVDVMHGWETNRDMRWSDDSQGPVLIDRTTGLPRRLVVDNGVLSTEAV